MAVNEFVITQGTQGPTGPRGVIGETGAKGDTGNTGAIGPQGVIGPTGPQGSIGLKGDIGSQGIQGVPGADGQTTGIALASAVLSLTSKNLFNAATINNNCWLRYTTDGGITAAAGYYTSDYFLVQPGGNVICNAVVFVSGTLTGWSFYDVNKTFISGNAGGVADVALAVPANAVYARVCVAGLKMAASAVMVFSGTSLPSSYIPWGIDSPVASSVSTAQAQLIDYVDRSVILSNRFNAATITTGGSLHYADSSPVAGLPANYIISDFMAINPSSYLTCNQSSIVNTGFGWCFYDITKKFISGVLGVAGNTPVPTPAGAAYARIPFDTTKFVVVPGGGGVASVVVSVGQTARVAPGPLAGLNWMPFGDSITATRTPAYSPLVALKTGLTVPQQSGAGGGTTQQIFANYGNNPATGLGQGGVIGGVLQTNIPGPWAPAGNTLAQDLANVDVVTIFLGTNDAPLAANLGALGDAIGSGTYYGYLRYAIEGILVAKPSVRLMWITPYMQVDSGAMTPIIVAAQKAICASYGIPVLDLFTESGINPLTYDYYIHDDHIHPVGDANSGGVRVVVNLISTFMMRYLGGI